MSLVAHPNYETQLAAKYVHGDVLSGEALASKLRNQVTYLVRQYTRTSEDAEDLTQECLLRVFQCMPNLDVARPLYPWLSAIVRNVSVNWLRQRMRLQNVPIETVSETMVDEQALEAISQEQNTVIEDVLATLEALDQTLLEYRFFYEMGYAEIGAKVGLTADCVRKRVARSLDKLQRNQQMRSLLEEEA